MLFYYTRQAPCCQGVCENKSTPLFRTENPEERICGRPADVSGGKFSDWKGRRPLGHGCWKPLRNKELRAFQKNRAVFSDIDFTKRRIGASAIFLRCENFEFRVVPRPRRYFSKSIKKQSARWFMLTFESAVPGSEVFDCSVHRPKSRQIAGGWSPCLQIGADMKIMHRKISEFNREAGLRHISGKASIIPRRSQVLWIYFS